MTVNDSLELWPRVQAGDEAASQEVFDRYVAQLVALTRRNLSHRLAKRVDPDDIVQSAYRSFFVNARDGRFEIGKSGDLWRLLAAITINKLRRQVARNTSNKRDYRLEQSGAPSNSMIGIVATVAGREPDPAEGAALSDEIAALLADLRSEQRIMLERRLQGYTHEEIAAELQCTDRTVRRFFERLRHQLKQSLLDSLSNDDRSG